MAATLKPPSPISLTGSTSTPLTPRMIASLTDALIETGYSVHSLRAATVWGITQELRNRNRAYAVSAQMQEGLISGVVVSLGKIRPALPEGGRYRTLEAWSPEAGLVTRPAQRVSASDQRKIDRLMPRGELRVQFRVGESSVVVMSGFAARPEVGNVLMVLPKAMVYSAVDDFARVAGPHVPAAGVTRQIQFDKIFQAISYQGFRRLGGGAIKAGINTLIVDAEIGAISSVLAKRVQALAMRLKSGCNGLRSALARIKDSLKVP